eukprot:9769441-Prorocentrum_lima.AAC.1
MTSSLVGSEMCIRDRWIKSPGAARRRTSSIASAIPLASASNAELCPGKAVSYTHLTLPTICSV